MGNDNPFISIVAAFYRALIFLYPASFRQEFGHEMVVIFRDVSRSEQDNRGGEALIRLWIGHFLDLIKTALDEHIWELFLRPGEKLKRIGGPAVAIGGPLFALGVIWSTISSKTPVHMDLNMVMIFLTSMPLLGVGLFALYKRLPITIGQIGTLLFGITLAGLFLFNAGFVITLLAEKLTLYAVGGLGYFLMILGMAGMGVIVFTGQILKRLSFTPILVAISMALLIFAGAANNYVMSIGLNILLICFAIGWFLLGIALWTVPIGPTGQDL